MVMGAELLTAGLLSATARKEYIDPVQEKTAAPCCHGAGNADREQESKRRGPGVLNGAQQAAWPPS